MDEIVDVLDSETGLEIGEVISKSDAHRLGIWHKAIHIWIISEDKKRILLQKRCPEKKLFPNMWDISVGGHVSSGEDSLISAKRELFEELGLDSDIYRLEYIAKVKEQFAYKEIVSNEYVDVYKIIGDIDIDNLKLQTEEVSEAAWFTKDEFKLLIDTDKIIKHQEEYDMINDILE